MSNFSKTLVLIVNIPLTLLVVYKHLENVDITTSTANHHSRWPRWLSLPRIDILLPSWAIIASCVALMLLWTTRTTANIENDTDKRDSKIYGLEHGILNLDMTTAPKTWWMNMGYWRAQPTPKDLPAACRALLVEVLRTAGIDSHPQSSQGLRDSSDSATSPPSVNVIDVGFGCGDQTLVIQAMENVRQYAGVTLDARQFTFAKDRILRGQSAEQKRMHLFHADAAAPSAWPPALKRLTSDMTRRTITEGYSEKTENWLLALDTLYHFKPSRLPLFKHTHQELHASIAAFDLLLTDQPVGIVQRLLLRLACLAFSSPYSNFLTQSDYRRLLVSAGYVATDIDIVDISDHVFGPLAEFLGYQHKQLKVLGLGIGRFKAAKWLFGQWARSGVVRGCIVVARRRSSAR